ncbi:MAG: hypothetical protein ACR2RF_20930 [Geminicoccaceae bacterium]
MAGLPNTQGNKTVNAAPHAIDVRYQSAEASKLIPAPPFLDGLTAGRLGQLGQLDLTAGADNLLLNCVDARAGDRLLIVREDSRHGYYDCTVSAFVADRARVLGLAVLEVEVGPPGVDLDLPQDLKAMMAKVDHTVFFARMGDQLRFDGLPGQCTKTVVYAYDAACLGSGFGTTSHTLMREVKAYVERRMMQAARIEITCPLGTELAGSPAAFTDDEAGDVKVSRFPMTVFKPVPATDFSGRIALARWLIGSGSRYYQPFEARLDEPAFAILDQGRVIDFEGPAAVVAKVQEHHIKVGEMFGIDPFCVHSWHAGIHPRTFYPLPAAHNPARWSALAFGSPRYLHFHVCGDHPPGEICWTVIDPTIKLDGISAWQNGRLALAETQEAKAILQNYQDGLAAFAQPLSEIGI